METYFKKLAHKMNIDLSEKQMKQFFQFKKMLLETNRYMNLTSITEDKDIILKHFIDSISIHSYIEKDKTLIDVGTGAGFPGIPIKIIREDVSITLLDSLKKRLNFLDQVIIDLDLKTINTIHGRAEDIAKQEEYREKYDYVTARAVANLSTLSELCLPFLKVGGKFICMKANIDEEIKQAENAILKLGGKIISVDQFCLPESDIERNIIVIKKEKNTPKQYPRKAGTPAREPIQ